MTSSSSPAQAVSFPPLASQTSLPANRTTTSLPPVEARVAFVSSSIVPMRFAVCSSR
jgi:hypothetical protein